MFKPNCVIALLAPEISIKSKRVQSKMHAVIRNNIVEYLKNNNIPYSSVTTKSGRAFIKTNEFEKTISILRYCFGINLLMSAQEENFSNAKEISEFALKLCKNKIKDGFAVRCKSLTNIKSKEIEIELGSLILKNIPKTKVNLDNPKTQCNILIFEEKVFYYFDFVEGVEGMPLGSQGKVALFVSNKKDSTELGKSLMKFGCVPVLIKNSLPLEKYNLSKPLEVVSLEKAKQLYKKHKLIAFFSDAQTLKERQNFDKLAEAKTFAPLILLA